MGISQPSKKRASLARWALVVCAGVSTVAAVSCAGQTSGPGSGAPGGSSGSGSGGSSGGSSGSSGTSSSGSPSTSSSSGGSSGSSSSSGAASSSGSSSGAPGLEAGTTLCATKVTPLNPVLINFDTYNGSTLAQDYGEAFGGATVASGTSYTGPYGFSGGGPGGAVDYTLSMVTGRTGGLTDAGLQDWAVDLALMDEVVWGGGVGIWMTCANASSFKGISFWARGQIPGNDLSLSLVTADTTPVSTGGTCTGSCVAPQVVSLPLDGLVWTQVTVPWASFVGGIASGAAYTPTGDNLAGLTFTVALDYAAVDAGPDGAAIYGPVPANIDFQLDDIEFMP
jgi:hypothetical protein